jgi:hypothetical protein
MFPSPSFIWAVAPLADVALVEDDLAIRGERIDRVPEDWRELTRSIARAAQGVQLVARL